MRVRYEENVKLNDNLVNMCYFTYSREILGDLWWSLIKIASIYLASSHLATNARCPDFLASIPEFLFISIGFCPKCNKLTLMEPGSWKFENQYSCILPSLHDSVGKLYLLTYEVYDLSSNMSDYILCNWIQVLRNEWCRKIRRIEYRR
jgi:hypothetical protein